MCWKLLDCSSRMASGWSFGFRFKLHILYVLISTNPESSFPLVRLKWSSLYILPQASVNKVLGLSFLARFQGFSTNPLSPTKSLWTPDQVLNLGREERPLSKVYRIRRSSIPQLRQREILNQTAQCLFKACIVLWLNWNEKTRF